MRFSQRTNTSAFTDPDSPLAALAEKTTGNVPLCVQTCLRRTDVVSTSNASDSPSPKSSVADAGEDVPAPNVVGSLTI